MATGHNAVGEGREKVLELTQDFFLWLPMIELIGRKARGKYTVDAQLVEMTLNLLLFPVHAKQWLYIRVFRD